MNRLRAITLALVAGIAATPLAVQAKAPAEQVIQVPGFADFLAPDGDTVWATNRGRIERWSRTQGKLAEVAIARPCGAMVIADGSLWAANCADGTVNRIDLATAKLVATIPTGLAKLTKSEHQLAAGAGSIWVASNATGQISRIDTATNQVVATIAVDPETSYLTFGFGSVWAVCLPGQTIQRIDPATNSVTKRTALGKAPGFLAAGEGAVWVQEQGDGTLARIDPTSGEVSGRVKVGTVLKYGDVDTGAGKVWLRTTEDQTFVAIDARTLEINARVGKPEGSGALRYTRDGLWTSAHDVHTLTWWPKPRKIAK
ncbi:YncE family protein [Novosphingobium sp. JCM 18896]|uniref:Vgb family protein n=1 Tax=Novosphingobium sp. JCM 18896 TaxID=2989731 RepID=UPI002221B67C|nr:YncE family protein [Novosphingobium sp. JCM 18896]MCW1430702.1 YncE family protein [Novosphingobium sp. JCM 18896]